LALVASACGPGTPPPFGEVVVRDYISMADLLEDSSAGAYVVGKAGVVNSGDALSHHHQTAFTKDDDFEIQPVTVGSVHDAIDERIRAANPGEVATVIVLRWTKTLLRTNIAGIDFVQVSCNATVVDRVARRVVGRRDFAGSAPEGTHRWGSSPEGDVVKWINALPRRAPQPSTPPPAQPAARDAAGDSAARTADVKAGATRRYLDAANGVAFEYPATWKQMGPEEARRVMGAGTSNYLTVVVYNPDDQTDNVNVQVLPTAAKDLTEASYTAFAKQVDGSLGAGFRKVSSRVGRLGEMPSLEYLVEATRPDGVQLRQKQLRTGKPGREVVLSFTARADRYAQLDAKVFKTIQETLTLK
jgi:hypothetical protein